LKAIDDAMTTLTRAYGSRVVGLSQVSEPSSYLKYSEQGVNRE
jgi:hypothetical protein